MVRLGKIFLLNCLAIHVIALDVIKPLYIPSYEHTSVKCLIYKSIPRRSS